jgi:alanine transaminase
MISKLWSAAGILHFSHSKSMGAGAAFNPTLHDRAASVRKKLPADFPQPDDLYFPSAYLKSSARTDKEKQRDRSAHLRGFCNWIVPRKIMVGQYPGQNPEISGPSAEEVQTHLSTLWHDAGITTFVSLQSETPPQDDYDKWNRNDGEIYLEGFVVRQQFPRPFTHYAPVIDAVLSSSNCRNGGCSQCKFLHWPIDDLSVPSNAQSLNDLLLTILSDLDDDGDSSVVYIHCWGGRGRAGLVASCLLSLLFPNMEAQVILDLVQAGYDTRLGAEEMPLGLSKSPQTESQRNFVREFVKLWRQHHF